MKDDSGHVEYGRVPKGYHQTMTGKQWDNLNAFVKRNRLKLVFTLNSGPSARNSDNSLNPRNIEDLMRYSRGKGYVVDVFELGNEHNLFWYLYGITKTVSADQYQKDILVLKNLMGKYYPGSKLGSQGSAIWPVLGELLGAFFGFYEGMIKNPEGMSISSPGTIIPSNHAGVLSRRAKPTRPVSLTRKTLTRPPTGRECLRN